MSLGAITFILVSITAIYSTSLFRLLSLENQVIHPQRIAGDQAIGCYRGRTFTQRFRPFDDLVQNDPIQNLDRGEERYKRGEDEKEEHKDGELESDGSKHVENPLYWVNPF